MSNGNTGAEALPGASAKGCGADSATHGTNPSLASPTRLVIHLEEIRAVHENGAEQRAAAPGGGKVLLQL
ncbi:hypothetical protein E2C01_078462 [Portunus trituberculatus]|uniref:Uncharacterized protein n=1 Tax=Portunus trituberculatus TaxID=210409 RepID=A0A5B7IQ80_PORTR|nr:hypothetical protein [Portunus trituberculatus]